MSQVLVFQEKDDPSKSLENMGAFQKLPMVMPSIDILHSALKTAKRVSPTKGTFSSMRFCFSVCLADLVT